MFTDSLHVSFLFIFVLYIILLIVITIRRCQQVSWCMTIWPIFYILYLCLSCIVAIRSQLHLLSVYHSSTVPPFLLVSFVLNCYPSSLSPPLWLQGLSGLYTTVFYFSSLRHHLPFLLARQTPRNNVHTPASVSTTLTAAPGHEADECTKQTNCIINTWLALALVRMCVNFSLFSTDRFVQ